jgi:hypothetical protein
MRDVPQYRAQLSHADPSYAMPSVNQNAAYPVSAVWEPPFVILTHLVGSNASTAVMDGSGAALTSRGRWQPAGPSTGNACLLIVHQYTTAAAAALLVAAQDLT